MGKNRKENGLKASDILLFEPDWKKRIGQTSMIMTSAY